MGTPQGLQGLHVGFGISLRPRTRDAGGQALISLFKIKGDETVVPWDGESQRRATTGGVLEKDYGWDPRAQ